VTGHNGSWFCDPACVPSGPENRGGYTFQWQRCDATGAGCVNIANADEQDYVVQADDRGSTLRVAVTATNYDCNANNQDCRYSSATAFSSVTAVVPGSPPFVPPPPPDPEVGPPVSMALPVAAGLPQEGQTLTASTGDWNGHQPLGFTYQWTRCAASGSGVCSAIAGATSVSYPVGVADVGSTLRVAVTATNEFGTASATSQPTVIVVVIPNIVPAAMSPPGVFGTAREGSTLTAAAGSWSGSPTPTFSFAWLRCAREGGACLPIAGATGATYTAGAADGGRSLKVLVTATNRAGSATAASPPTAIVDPKGLLHLVDGRESVPASGVLFPDGLRIDSTRFTTRDGRTIRATLHVSDSRGYVVRGALVSLRPVRQGEAASGQARATTSDGTVTLMLTVGAAKRAQGGKLTLIVRATKRGDDPGRSVANRVRVTLKLRARR
jgi:hypothetical protein